MILEFRYCIVSEVGFVGVKNRNEIDKILDVILNPSNPIYSIEKTDKREFTVHSSPPLKIICDNIQEF